MNGKTSVHTQRESNMSIPGLRRSVGVCILTTMLVAVRWAEGGIIEAYAYASRDATVFDEIENSGNNSLGGGATFFAGKNSNGSARRALLAFDLAGIPEASTINSVRLDLVLAQAASGGGGTPPVIGVHKLLDNWGEGTTGWGKGPGGYGTGRPAAPGDATWIYQFYDSDPWAKTGGDFADIASGITTVGNAINATYSWNSTAAMVADVQGWLDDPSTNFGWLLYGDESKTTTFRAFWSKEAHVEDEARAAYEPKLVIYYTAVPEPMSFVLFAGGAVALLVMRRARRRSGIPGGRSESDLRWH
jgi:hypothetical protein